ncbi:TPA: hypothetical protein U2Q41_001152 [Citrobacter koseri]|uniref:hypothetical protein n=1 Tax=Citrobacter koseri TaxID=545 RepID=UPI002AB5D7B3|nr:hypothetical protein [Citrobacter koseri]HEM8504420.1 hypothetical protein [Citrobacter koseri]HEM8571018.1 hypothetical protein [Citrobacter koseri]
MKVKIMAGLLLGSVMFLGLFFFVEQSPKKVNMLVVGYGQSLMTGMEGWPALTTKTSVDNAFMIGDSVRPDSRRSQHYKPVGNSVRPLTSTVQQVDDSSKLVSPEYVSKLKRGAINEGEEPIVGAVTAFSGFRINSFESIFGMNAGVSGSDILQISKGSGYYKRFTDAVKIFNAISINEKRDPVVSSIVFMQGEMNYMPTYENAPQDYNRYLSALKKLHNNMLSDAVSITKQKDKPLFFMYQTGGSFSRDTNDLSVGMAQLDFSNTNDGVYMVGPTYQYPDKGGHLGPNGYRWFGVQIAKVMHQVIDKGVNWKPLQPLSVSLSNDKVVVRYGVPYPPLKFTEAYVKYDPVMYDDKGFTLYDSNGRVDISSVEITAQDEITITPVHKITGPAKLFYADKSYHNGNGNVSDSDDTVSPYKYEYKEGSGQYPESNIKELVDKPYPLNNFSVAFCLPVTM